MKSFIRALNNGYELLTVKDTDSDTWDAKKASIVRYTKEDEKWIKRNISNIKECDFYDSSICNTFGLRSLIDLDTDFVEISNNDRVDVAYNFESLCSDNLAVVNTLIFKLCCLLGIRVQYTKDYIFNKLKGNREVTEVRVGKILKSIDQIGPITTPIIVNEKYEIIDGQGRAVALSNLGLPIPYIKIPGLGVTECRAMNIDQSNWSISDWVDSFADKGQEDYIYFQKLIDRYENLNIATINNAITGATATNNDAIKNGYYECDKQTYQNAIKILDYVNKFERIAHKTKMKGRRIYLLAAVAYCYSLSSVDKDRLLECFEKNHSDGSRIVNMDSALEEMENVYNKRCRTKNIYLKDSYKRMMDERDKRIKANRKKAKKVQNTNKQ